MYKKFLFLIIVILFFANSTYTKTLNGGVSYTVKTARIEAFDALPLHIDIKKYKDYFKDINNQKNLKAISNGKCNFKDRTLTIFDDGDYGVYYLKKRMGFYYSPNGDIKGITIEYNNNYPIKSTKYDINGKMISTSLNVRKNEDYIFDYNGKLIAHWIGSNCYNENGELIGTRD